MPAPALATANVVGIDGGAASSASISGTTSAAINAGETLILVISSDGSGVPTAVSVGGVSGSVVPNGWAGADPDCWLAFVYCASALASGAAVSVTLSAASTNRGVAGATFTGVAPTSPVDHNPAGTQTAAATAYTGPSTTVATDELAITGITYWVGGSTHAASGSSSEAADFACTGADKTLAITYRSTTGSNTGTFTGGGNQNISMASAAFMAGVAAAPTFDPDFSCFPKPPLRRERRFR